MNDYIMNDYNSNFLVEQFKKIGILLSDTQIYQFLMFYDLLIEKNKVMNLTSITGFEDVVIKHFIDSVLVCRVFDISKFHSLIDIGSGAGFPGIPLKIVFPDLDILLLDSLNKRVSFLNCVAENLHLKNVSIIHSRAEDSAINPDFREKFDICVSRAVSNLSVLLEYCLPFVKKEGFFISYKSSDISEEFVKAEHVVQLLGGQVSSLKNCPIPGTDIKRTFVIIKKIKRTPLQYPRKAGIPSRNPLN